MTRVFTSFETKSKRPGNTNHPALLQDLIDFIEGLVNLVLAMTRRGGLIRQQILTAAFLVLWTVIAFDSHPWPDWAVTIIGILPGFSVDGASPVVNLTITLFRLLQTYFAIDVLTRLIALIFPFWLAHRAASIYLADIFEQELPVAQRFIGQAAFAFPGYDIIRIEEGRVRLDDMRSPVFRIGGPGYVRVNLENAAIFEKINGTCEIIGPTYREATNFRPLEGFERLRKAFDLRDQILMIDKVSGRTKEGIRVMVEHIRLIFSVQRDSHEPDLSRPYPFSSKALHWLVYQQGTGPWETSMTMLVQNELMKFIGEHRLSDLMSSIGEPEIKRQIELETLIQKHIWRIQRHSRRYHTDKQVYLPKLWNLHSAPPLPFRKRKHGKKMHPSRVLSRLVISTQPPPNAVSRAQIRNIFTPDKQLYEKFTSAFPERAQQRGLRLEWIDVGTWRTPDEIPLRQHLDAWKLTNENMMRGHPMVLKELQNQNRIRELARLVRRVPIFAFNELHARHAQNLDLLIYDLIDEYHSLIRAARDQYLAAGRPVPAELDRVYALIRRYQTNFYKNGNRGRYLQP